MCKQSASSGSARDWSSATRWATGLTCLIALSGCSTDGGGSKPGNGAGTGGLGDAGGPSVTAGTGGGATATGGGAGEGIGGTGGSGTGGSSSSVLGGLNFFPADDENIQYSGRVDFTKPKEPKFSAPGVSITTKFNGTQVGFKLKAGGNANYYAAVVDDREPVIIRATLAGEFMVAKDLPAGDHLLTIHKRSEAKNGSGIFFGIATDGKLIAPPAKPTRKIEIIGDSISAGDGMLGPNNSDGCNQQKTPWGTMHDAPNTYGAVLSRALKAEYHITAVAGIGLIRNYDSFDARPMPAVYDLVFTQNKEATPVWDHKKFIPDAVIINLGTNDFSPGSSPRPYMTVEEFVPAMKTFYTKLRGYYADASFFFVSSPMLDDGWPDGQPSLTNQETALQQVVTDLKEDNVFYFDIGSYGKGCGTHPDVSEHAEMADKLGAFIGEKMGWTE
jgi:lysophospholipase L1-like esterase